MTLHRVAQLVLDEPQESGYLLFADFSKSPRFFTVEGALKEVQKALEKNTILPPEAEFLYTEISRSPLLTKDQLQVVDLLSQHLGVTVKQVLYKKRSH